MGRGLNLERGFGGLARLRHTAWLSERTAAQFIALNGAARDRPLRWNGAVQKCDANVDFVLYYEHNWLL